MRNMTLSALLVSAFAVVSMRTDVAPGWAASDDVRASGEMNTDPLRQFLPRRDLFMPLPGGVAATTSDAEAGASVEETLRQNHGGLVVGYCLKSSCSRVTHLAVLQVCGSRIGGPKGRDELVLGFVKLPLGHMPGYLMSLQGRNYADNFSANGPVRQELVEQDTEGVDSLFSLWADGMGPVAPLEYLGLAISPRQGRDTLSLQLTMMRDPRTGHPFPRLEVRHLCKRSMS